MTPEELERMLLENQDLKYRDFQMKIIPGVGNEMIGVRMPVVRDIAKKVVKEDWRTFLGYPSRSYEHTLVKALVIATAKMDVHERIELTKGFVPEVDNWAVNDTMCMAWKVGKKDREVLWDYCMELVSTGEEFPMRVGTVLAMSHLIDEDHIDRLLKVLVETGPHGYYYDMGAAWALSVCYIKFQDRTEKTMFDGRLDPGIMKMTVRKIRDSFRVDKESKDRVLEKSRKYR